MKRYNKFIFILFVTAILSGIATSLEAQDKPKKKKTALIEVKGLVTDNTGPADTFFHRLHVRVCPFLKHIDLHFVI